MDGDRDKFSPQEKVDLVLELLKGKKDLQTFAAEHKVSPELLAAWREEFLAKAARVSDHRKAELVFAVAFAVEAVGTEDFVGLFH